MKAKEIMKASGKLPSQDAQPLAGAAAGIRRRIRAQACRGVSAGYRRLQPDDRR